MQNYTRAHSLRSPSKQKVQTRLHNRKPWTEALFRHGISMEREEETEGHEEIKKNTYVQSKTALANAKRSFDLTPKSQKLFELYIPFAISIKY